MTQPTEGRLSSGPVERDKPNSKQQLERAPASPAGPRPAARRQIHPPDSSQSSMMPGLDEFLWPIYSTGRAQYLTGKIWVLLLFLAQRCVTDAWACSAKLHEIVAAGISQSAYYKARDKLKYYGLIETRLIDDEIEFQLFQRLDEVEKRPFKARGLLARRLPNQGTRSQKRESTVVPSTSVLKNSITKSSSTHGSQPSVEQAEITAAMEILMSGDREGRNKPGPRQMLKYLVQLAADPNTVSILVPVVKIVHGRWCDKPDNLRKPAMLMAMVRDDGPIHAEEVLKRKAKDLRAEKLRAERRAARSPEEQKAVEELEAKAAAKRAFARLPLAKQKALHLQAAPALPPAMARKYREWSGGEPLRMALVEFAAELQFSKIRATGKPG